MGNDKVCFYHDAIRHHALFTLKELIQIEFQIEFEFLNTFMNFGFMIAFWDHFLFFVWQNRCPVRVPVSCVKMSEFRCTYLTHKSDGKRLINSFDESYFEEIGREVEPYRTQESVGNSIKHRRPYHFLHLPFLKPITME